MDVISLADRSWPLLRRLMGAHAHVYRLTNGVVAIGSARQIRLVILEPRKPSSSG